MFEMFVYVCKRCIFCNGMFFLNNHLCNYTKTVIRHRLPVELSRLSLDHAERNWTGRSANRTKKQHGKKFNQLGSNASLTNKPKDACMY